MNNKKQITLFIPIAFLSVAILIPDLPYGYYTLLRFIVCFFALYYVWLIKNDNNNILSAVFIIVAILFNPIIPIELPRHIWQYIDMILVIAYLVYFLAPSFFSSDGVLDNRRIFALIVTVVLLIAVLFNRWEVRSGGEFSYHHDLLTSHVLKKSGDLIVDRAYLPAFAIAISNVVTFIIYTLIGATSIALFKEIGKKRQSS